MQGTGGVLHTWSAPPKPFRTFTTAKAANSGADAWTENVAIWMAAPTQFFSQRQEEDSKRECVTSCNNLDRGDQNMRDPRSKIAYRAKPEPINKPDIG